jgi:hypothetical protein
VLHGEIDFPMEESNQHHLPSKTKQKKDFFSLETSEATAAQGLALPGQLCMVTACREYCWRRLASICCYLLNSKASHGIYAT